MVIFIIISPEISAFLLSFRILVVLFFFKEENIPIVFDTFRCGNFETELCFFSIVCERERDSLVYMPMRRNN